MKKLICAFICVFILIPFTGCKDKTDTANGGVDISYFADAGAIPESEFKLGDAPPEKTEDSTGYFFADEGDGHYFSNGDFSYYCSDDEKEPQITAIAAFSEFYGFENGAISIEVTDTLNSQNIKYTERVPAEKELFFLPASGDFSIVECKSLKNDLIFVFEENALCAALISRRK